MCWNRWLEVSHADEPTAVADLAATDNAGCSGVSAAALHCQREKAKVTYLRRMQLTGGHHISDFAEIAVFRWKRRSSKRGHGEEIWPAVKPVYEKMADIVARHIEGQGITDLWLAGGPCLQPGVAELFRKQFPALQVHLPQHSLFMTPLAIASSGREKAEGLYAK